MNNSLILAVALALLIGGIGGYVVSEATGHRGYRSDGGMHLMNKQRAEGAKVTQARTSMMDHSMHGQMMVADEREFIEHMIPHHQEAIDTAQEVLARGGSTPEIRALAEAIIAAQTKEITDMKSWYEAWYGTPYQDNGKYVPMMRDLAPLSGAELDRAFLEDMMHHHMGAVMMARSVEQVAEHDEMRTLAENIIQTQTEEMEQMRNLLTTL